MGNVWEWCHDWYQKDLGSQAVTDPVGTQPGSGLRVVRGGSYFDSASTGRAANRSAWVPSTRFYSLGFRCVRTMP